MRRTMHGRRFACATAVLALLGSGLALADCGGSDGAGSGSAASSTSTSRPSTSESALAAPMRVTYGDGVVGPADPTTTLPNEAGRPILPVIAPGQNIVITGQGCLPKELEASVDAPVVWTNLSGKPARVIFRDFPVDSGTIPVGGTFTWSDDQALSFGYVLEPGGHVCQLAMNPSNP